VEEERIWLPFYLAIEERMGLPARPLARLKRRGAGGRVFEKRSLQDLQEGVELFLGRRSVTWKPLLVICVDARE
jgi:hypothetical protein